MNATILTSGKHGAKTGADIPAQNVVALAFDPSAAEVERMENDLAFFLPSGDMFVFTNFFAPDRAQLPYFLLPNGCTVPAASLLKLRNANMDVSSGNVESLAHYVYRNLNAFWRWPRRR